VVVRDAQYLYLDAGSSCLVTNRGTAVGLCIGVPTLNLADGRETEDGHDPVLGRSLVLSTRASAMGRTLENYGRRIANDPALGDALHGQIVANVVSAYADTQLVST